MLQSTLRPLLTSSAAAQPSAAFMPLHLPKHTPTGAAAAGARVVHSVRSAPLRRIVPNRSRSAPAPPPLKSSQYDVEGLAPGPRDTSLGPRDDDVLPESLPDSLRQAAEATAEAIGRDNARCQVEILLTEFWDPISGPLFPNRGDQERFWKITRRFVEELSTALKQPKMNVVYPDAGVAAMLSYQWKDPEQPLPFRITSLTDRIPVTLEDEVIVVACPDPPGAEECIKLVRTAREQDEKEGRPYRPVVLFNPRLSSGDVGLGLNARRLRESFTKNFVVTYSLRPIADIGSVYRRYPGLWKVFLEEEEPGMAGRYRLIAEEPSRPAGEALDYMIMEASTQGPLGPDGQPQKAQGAQGFFNQLQSVVTSIGYFMRSLK